MGKDEGVVVQGMDRLSQLPHHIFHHILSFLPQKDAVKTCVLSKPCSYLSSTRPNVEFCERDFRRRNYPESFTHAVERTLQGYLDQNLRIHKFCVELHSYRLVSLLEKWVPKVVSDLGVNTLEVIGEWQREYSHFFDLPPELFKSQSLQKLYLNHCRWTPDGEKLLFKRLTTLSLHYVIIEDADFEKTMSSCPLIEHVVLHNCRGLRTINYVNHHNLNLNYFEFSCSYDSEGGASIEIYTPRIATLKIKSCPNWNNINRRPQQFYYPNLKSLRLHRVAVQDGDFEKIIMSSCPLIEHVVLKCCDGLRSVNYVDNHNFKLNYFKFTPLVESEDIRICTPSITTLILSRCPDWMLQLQRHQLTLCYPNLKCLRLHNVRVPEDVFDGFSSSLFPCLEELELEISLSRFSILCISTATTCNNKWKSCVETKLYVRLDFDVSSWLLKMSELLTGVRQSEITTLDITILGSDGYEELRNDLPGRLVPDINYYYNNNNKPAAVAVEDLRLVCVCIYSESSFPRFLDALFRVCRPRKMGTHQWFAVEYHWEHSIEQNGITKSLCKILQKDEEYCGDDQEYLRMMSGSWQQDLEEVIMEVLLDENNTGEMWHPVLATTNWLEHCDALTPKKQENEPDESYKIRFQFRWC